MAFSTAPLACDVEGFVEYLAGRGWLHARRIIAELSLTKRHLRSLAEHAKGRVLSGNAGYKLTSEATLPELEAFSQRMLSQTKRTQRRVSDTLTVFEAAKSNPSNPF